MQFYRRLKTDADLRNIPVILLSVIATKTYFHARGWIAEDADEALPVPEAFIEKLPEPEELLHWTRFLLHETAMSPSAHGGPEGVGKSAGQSKRG